MRALVIALSLVVSPRIVDALCVTPQEHPVVLNDGAAVSPSGGLVVATVVDGQAPDEGGALQPTWTFKTAAGTAKPATVALAPGLVLYRLDKPSAAELHDGKKARATMTAASQEPAAIAPPEVASVVHTATRSPRGNSSNVLVEVKAVPAEAIALVAFDAKTKAARSFARVTGQTKSLYIYAQGRCSALPDGTVATGAGDKLVLRWVDKYGRWSAPTKPLVVARAK